MTNPTILVVEDNSDDLELTLTALKKYGLPHHIVVARDGLEALEYLFCQGLYSDRDPNKQPELVLTDLSMPKMNGLQLIQRMRDDPRTFFVPVVMLTTSSGESEAVLAFKGGLNSYVSKPLDFRDLEEKLEEIREYWRTSNLAPLSS